MKRRQFLLVALAGLPTSPSTAQKARVYRVGVLLDDPLPAFQAFRDRLRQLGYVEAQNLELLVRLTEGDQSKFPALAADLVRADVDVIATYATPATLAAKAATLTIPIITAGVSDAAADRFFASLARPGGNLTGFITMSTAIYGKRLAILKEFLPKLSRVALVSDFSINLNSGAAFEILAKLAAQVGVSAHRADIRANNLSESLSSALKEDFDAAFVSIEPALWTRRSEIASFMASRRLPALYGSRDYVEAGGLISYGTDYHELFRRAAEYVDRILKGQKPDQLPAQQAERFEMVINIKVAQALGLDIPPSLLARADAVVE
jgi:putative tryptophan/tyrosine transport system substrate-binding protein